MVFGQNMNMMKKGIK